MKITIPLDSTLCTDSHKNDIKNPMSGRDLFSKNQSYLINRHLTNPKKQIVEDGDYITTKGDRLRVERSAEKIRIYNDDVLIAGVLSLGIEDTSFLDRDDAVIDDGYLWTVRKSVLGYVVERTNLQTNEKETVTVDRDAQTSNISIVRFIRNTHKIITLNNNGSVTINNYPYVDGNNNLEITYNDEDMNGYLGIFSGEFTAAEINGKIIFGLNNPMGEITNYDRNVISYTIDNNINGWLLSDIMRILALDQNESYIFNITVADNVQIGAAESGFAMDFVTGITKPLSHIINLSVGTNAIISGRGGDGGWRHYNTGIDEPLIGTTAIFIASNINITGQGTIQGGGGGGGYGEYLVGMMPSYVSGGGGAGIPAGIPRGTISSGGSGVSGSSLLSSGDGGNPGKNGGNSIKQNGANGGNAMKIISPAIYTNNGVTLLGGVITV
jgi:hypothetical protein